MKSIKYFGSGEWIHNGVKVNKLEDADLVIMPGGADINPALYGHKAIPETHWSENYDKPQLAILNKAIEMGKGLFGICRGMQILTARAGGWLIQDSSHPSRHAITTVDGEVIETNSCHHQQCYVYDMPKEDYELIAWAEHLSPRHIIEGGIQLEYKPESLDEKGRFKEPEIIAFPKLNAMGCQFHPEWLMRGRAVDYLNNLLREKLSF